MFLLGSHWNGDFTPFSLHPTKGIYNEYEKEYILMKWIEQGAAALYIPP